MIVTVTPAPAIDWTVRVEDFALGAVNRVVASEREPSGKGVNVSWALRRAGVPTRAVLPAGGHSGALMTAALTRAGVEHVVVDTGREVRTNITLVAGGTSTKINDTPGALTSAQGQALRAAACRAAADADVVLVCGSLPPGVAAHWVRDLVRALHRPGLDVVVDSSGPALALALQAGPSLVKPNVAELAELTGRQIATFADVVDAAQVARDRGAGAVLASLGPDGAMLVDHDGALWAQARDIPFRNSVGAGDALLAGFLSTEGPPARRLSTATLWASSAVAHATTLFPIRPELAERITLGPIPSTRRLREPGAPLQPAPA